MRLLEKLPTAVAGFRLTMSAIRGGVPGNGVKEEVCYGMEKGMVNMTSKYEFKEVKEDSNWVIDNP